MSSFSRSPNSLRSANPRLYHSLWTAVRNPMGFTFWPKMCLLVFFLNHFFDGFSSVSTMLMCPIFLRMGDALPRARGQ